MWYTYRGFLRGRWCQDQRYKKPIVIVWVPWGANCDGDLCAVGLLGVVLGETLLMGRGIQDCAERGWMPMQLQLSPQPYSRGAPGWGDSFEMPWTEVRGPSFCNCLLTGDWVGSSFPQLRVISEEWWSPLQWARVQTLAGELKSCTLCGHKQRIIQPEAGECVSQSWKGVLGRSLCATQICLPCIPYLRMTPLGVQDELYPRSEPVVSGLELIPPPSSTTPSGFLSFSLPSVCLGSLPRL